MANEMSGTFLDDFAEVAADPPVIDTTAAGLLREARGNLWTFAVTAAQARALTVEAVSRFLQGIADARSAALAARHGAPHPMWFYCWCDEAAAQLRFSLVSVAHGRLPFAGAIEEADDLAAIVARFLALPHHDGIAIGAETESDIRARVAGTSAQGAPPPSIEGSRSGPANAVGGPLTVWVRRLPLA